MRTIQVVSFPIGGGEDGVQGQYNILSSEVWLTSLRGEVSRRGGGGGVDSEIGPLRAPRVSAKAWTHGRRRQDLRKARYSTLGNVRKTLRVDGRDGGECGDQDGGKHDLRS